jgi:hypothetical protein
MLKRYELSSHKKIWRKLKALIMWNKSTWKGYLLHDCK